MGGCGIIAASMWLRVDQGRLHAISRGGVGGGGGGGRASGGVVVLGGQSQQQPWCRREASEQKCGLAGSRCLCLSGGDTDRDSLELRGRQPATTRVEEGYTENTDTSRTLGSNHQTKQRPATTHQHRSATARSRSRSREALRHELMYTNHLAELRLCRLLPMPWALVLP